MTQLFVSFYYIGTEGFINNHYVDHKEFDNMVIEEPYPNELEERTFIEWLHEKANDYTIKELGMKSCSCRILYWKKLNE